MRYLIGAILLGTALGCVPRVHMTGPDTETWAYLYIRSDPPGASFTVRGAPQPLYASASGTTPGGVTVVLPEPGENVRLTVHCEKEGYLPQIRDISFPARRAVKFHLRKPMPRFWEAAEGVEPEE